MAKIISPVANNESFGEWVDVTNQLVAMAALTVTTSGGANADITVGKAYINGSIGSNAIYATTLYGGTTVANSALTISSNTIFSGSQINAASNAYVSGVSVILGSANNLTINNANSNVTTVVSGNTLVISANASFTGRILTVPSGNTAQRPVNVASGTLRYNADVETIELFANAAWKTISAFSNTLNAATVSFAPTANIGASNVQAALVEVYTEKASLIGDIFTGAIVVNKTGGSMPPIVNGSVIHLASEDNMTTRIQMDVFAETTGITARRANGTNAIKSRVSTDDVIFAINAEGYDGNSYSSGTRSIEIRALENWSNTSHGSYTVFRNTPTGNTLPNAYSLIVGANTVSVPGFFTAGGTAQSANLIVTGTSAFGNNVAVTGDVSATGGLYAYSDRRLKSNIEKIENALEIIKKLSGKRYIKDGENKVGLIAQDVIEWLPEVVHEDASPEKLLSIAYGDIVAVLIEAVKTLDARITVLEK